MASVRDDLKSEIADLRTEMTERFISIDEQMRTLALRVQQFDTRLQGDVKSVRDQASHFEARVLDEFKILKETLSGMGDRMKAVEDGTIGIHGRVDTLSEEMRQRFRGVNDRLSGIEKRNAA